MNQLVLTMILFKDYIHSLVPSALAKKLYETKDKKKHNELVELRSDGVI